MEKTTKCYYSLKYNGFFKLQLNVFTADNITVVFAIMQQH